MNTRADRANVTRETLEQVPSFVTELLEERGIPPRTAVGTVVRVMCNPIKSRNFKPTAWCDVVWDTPTDVVTEPQLITGA